MNQEVISKLDLAKETVDHPGEGGRARENIIAGFFRKLLPGLFKVDTGFVIDGLGQKSKQIDIVIYRDDYHPVFDIGGWFLRFDDFPACEDATTGKEDKTTACSRSSEGRVEAEFGNSPGDGGRLGRGIVR